MIRAVLFDIDGTLLDTRQFIFKAYEYSLLTNYQKKISWNDLAPLFGQSLVYTYSQLLPSGEIEILCQSHHRFQLENLHLAAPYPNVVKTLQKLKENGFRIGTISNRASNTTIKTLQLTNLDQYIDVVISADDVKKQKPNKEGIVKALKVLKVKPAQAIFVGDTEVDILTGNNTKVRTVGVTYGFLGEAIAKYNPDYLINEIGELPGIVLKL